MQQQADFTIGLATLLVAAYERGMTVTLGEIERPSILARLYAKLGIGIADSQHADRLAADLKLYIDGKYQTSSSAYAWLGLAWKTHDKRARWGGNFPKPDGGHFEYIDP